MATNDGGPAYPVQVTAGSDGKEHGLQFGNRDYWATGMSLRDWFAGQALTGCLASDDDGWCHTPESAAKWAYQVADAMLKERE